MTAPFADGELRLAENPGQIRCRVELLNALLLSQQTQSVFNAVETLEKKINVHGWQYPPSCSGVWLGDHNIRLNRDCKGAIVCLIQGQGALRHSPGIIVSVSVLPVISTNSTFDVQSIVATNNSR